MDGRPRISVRDRTRLTGRLSRDSFAGGRSVFVGPPDALGRAGVADRSSFDERTEWQWKIPSAEEAAHLDLASAGMGEMATWRTLQRRICPERGIGVRWGASLRSTAMRARACAADRGMLNGAFVPWTEGSLDQVKRRRRGAILESCSGGAASRRSRRPMPSARRCSKSSPNGRNRSVRSSGWPPPARSSSRRQLTTTAAMRSASRNRCLGEQQRNVCLQLGYANCPRYLRGVLVIPTDELEALRRPPQKVPPPPPPHGRPPPVRIGKAAGEWSRPSSSSSSSSAAVSEHGGCWQDLARWRSGHHQPPSGRRLHPVPDRVDHAIGRGERCGHAGDIHHWSVELQPDRSRDAHRRCPADDTERVPTRPPRPGSRRPCRWRAVSWSPAR